MAKFTFNLPDIGEGIAEAEIVAWHVKVGDSIREDQPIADMMTDKATVEMESPVSGVVTKVAGEAGDVIAIGSMLVEIETATDVKDVSHDVPVPHQNPNKWLPSKTKCRTLRNRRLSLSLPRPSNRNRWNTKYHSHIQLSRPRPLCAPAPRISAWI